MGRCSLLGLAVGRRLLLLRLGRLGRSIVLPLRPRGVVRRHLGSVAFGILCV